MEHYRYLSWALIHFSDKTAVFLNVLSSTICIIREVPTYSRCIGDPENPKFDRK